MVFLKSKPRINVEHNKLLIAVFLLLINSSSALAAEDTDFDTDTDDEIDFFTLTIENDIIAGDDGGYTNGLAVSWANCQPGGEMLNRWPTRHIDTDLGGDIQDAGRLHTLDLREIMAKNSKEVFT